MSKIKGADNFMGEGANYGKFVVDNTPILGTGRTEDINHVIGEERFEKKCEGESIYDDETRETETAKEERDEMEAGKTGYSHDDNEDETQGGMY